MLLSVPGCHHYGDIWIMGSEGVCCVMQCAVCQVGLRWASDGLHCTIMVHRHSLETWSQQPVSLKMAPGQLSPLSLSFCQQNGESTQLYLGCDPAKLCSMLSPWWLSSSASSGSDNIVTHYTLYTEWLTAIMLRSVCVVTFRKRLKKVACFRVKCSVSMGSENPV